jgi:hypothetical protein
MSEWLAHLFRSLADQAGTWFVGFVLALLGLFSSRIVESVKFALNRADLRTKYYEELAVELSNFVFVIDRLVKVYYGSTWASSDEDKSAIAGAYDEAMSGICRKEYVYLSWLKRYWSMKGANAFIAIMEKIRAVDAVLIRLNEEDEGAKHDGGHGSKGFRQAEKQATIKDLESGFGDLQESARDLLWMIG